MVTPTEPPPQSEPSSAPKPPNGDGLAAPAKTSKAASKTAPPRTAPSPALPDPATRLGFFNPALDLSDLKLPPGTELTTAGPVDGYRALSAMSATKSATPLGKLPQSIAVLPIKVLVDQTSISLGEALENVSSVMGTARLQAPAYESMLIRGFPAERWIDGMPVYFDTGFRDSMANIERIEVLKGPNAILYGGGNGAPVGGAVNVISKLPTATAHGALGLTFGSHRYLRPTLDVNQPLAKDGSVLFRMTGEYVSSESFVDLLETEAYALNPTLTLTNKIDTTLIVQGSTSRWSQPDYQGLPAVGTVAGDFRIDRHLFIGPRDMPDSTVSRDSVTARLDHKFDEKLSGSIAARWSEAHIRERTQSLFGSDVIAANTPLVHPSTWGLTNAIISQDEEEISISGHLSERFDMGPAQNTLLLGGDYSHVTDSGFIATDLFLGGAGLVDLTHPAFPFPYIEPPLSPATAFADAGKSYVNQGLFVQLQSTLFERLHLIGSVRLADLKIDDVQHQDGTRDTAHATKLLPRAGAVLDIAEGVSLYASYGEGLKGHPIITHKGAPDPEESVEREAGIKLDLAGGLTGTLAAFEIERTNVPLLQNFVTVGLGDERSRGVEADLIWQPDRNWQVIGNVSLIEALHITASGVAPAGTKIIGAPEQSGRLWVNYRFDPGVLEGWSVGAGIYAASGAPVDPANRYFTDAYLTVDAKVGFDSADYSAVLSLKNLTDEVYFVPYNYAGGRVAAGGEREVYGSVTWKY